MRRYVLVTYDISDPKRLRKTYRLLRGYGDHLQFSVFLCELSKRERAQLWDRLNQTINQREDQVLLVDLGAVDGKQGHNIESIGRPFIASERLAIIV